MSEESFNFELQTNIANVSNCIKEAISQTQQIVQHYPNATSIQSTCVTCVQLTIKFKTATTEAYRPMFIHLGQIEKICKVMLTGLRKLADEVVAVTSNVWVGKVVENAIEATQQFQSWLVSNYEAYTVQATSELVFMNAYPPSDKDAVAKDMAHVPLWVSHSLYDMKVAQFNAEKKVVQTEADFKMYQANMQDMFEKQKKLVQSQYETQKAEYVQKLEYQENMITDLKYRAQESRKSLLAGKKEEFEKIEQGEQLIQDLRKQVADLEAKLTRTQMQVEEAYKRINEVEVEKASIENNSIILTNKIGVLEQKFAQEFEKQLAAKVAPTASQTTASSSTAQPISEMKEKQYEAQLSQLRQELTSTKKEHAHVLIKMKGLQQQLQTFPPIPTKGYSPASDLVSEPEFTVNEDGEKVPVEKDKIGELKSSSANPLSARSRENRGPVVSSYVDTRMDTNAIVAPFFELLNPINASFESALHWMTETDKHVCLAHLICDNVYDYSFTRLLGNVFVTGKNAENVVFAVLKIFEEQGRTMELIKRMIDQEIDNSDTSNQLFRGEDFPPRTLRAFTRIKGVQYLHQVLGQLIDEIIETDVCVLMDNRFSGTNTNEYLPPDELTIQQANEWCQRFFDAILKARDSLPLEFYEIANYLSYKTSIKYGHVEGAVQGSVAGFIFLRFFCPCITSPLNFGFKKPNKGAQTTLLLIGKVLQSLANGVKSFKEESYACLTPFLIKNQQPLGQYYRHISAFPQRAYGDSLYFKILSYYIHSDIPKMNDKLASVHPTRGDEMARLRSEPAQQVIEVAPLPQFEKLLEAIPKLTKPLVNNSAKTECKIVDRIKMPRALNDSLLIAVQNVVVENQAVVLGLVRLLIEKRWSGEAADIIKEAVPALVSAFVYRNAIDALFCYTIIAENSVAEVVDERKFLHEGVTRTLFHTVSLLPEFLQWIHGFLQPVLAVVKDIGKQAEDYSLATPEGTARAMPVFGELLQAFLESLNSSPKIFWMFCAVLTEYSPVDPFKFVLVNVVARSMEDPDTYRLPVALDKFNMAMVGVLIELSHQLANAADSPDDIQRTFYESFHKWIASGHPEGVVATTVDDEAELNSLFCLLDTAMYFEAEMKEQLRGLPRVAYNVEYMAKSLYASLNPVPLPKTNDLSFSQFELEEGVKRHRALWNTPTQFPTTPSKNSEVGNDKVKNGDSNQNSPSLTTNKKDRGDGTTPRKADSSVASKFKVGIGGKKGEKGEKSEKSEKSEKQPGEK